MTSYVPKQNKAVVLLSTHHHTTFVATDSTKKPEIIHFYNITKGAVDSFDKKIENFTCRRKTNRWTFNTFMFMVDIAASYSFALSKIKHSIRLVVDESRQKRKGLDDLAMDLIKQLVKQRIDAEARTNFSGIQKNCSRFIQTMRRCGGTICWPQSTNGNQNKGSKEVFPVQG